MQKQTILITPSTFWVFYQFIDYNKINQNSSQKNKTKQTTRTMLNNVKKIVNIVSKWYYCSTVSKFMLEWSHMRVKNKCFNAYDTSLVIMRFSALAYKNIVHFIIKSLRQTIKWYSNGFRLISQFIERTQWVFFFSPITLFLNFGISSKTPSKSLYQRNYLTFFLPSWNYKPKQHFERTVNVG